MLRMILSFLLYPEVFFLFQVFDVEKIQQFSCYIYFILYQDTMFLWYVFFNILFAIMFILYIHSGLLLIKSDIVSYWDSARYLGHGE